MKLKEIKMQRLQMYLDAEQKILLGQSYKIADRELTRANLKEVQAMINQLSAELSDASGNKKFMVSFVKSYCAMRNA